MDNTYEKLLEDELKRLVKSKITVSKDSSNYLIKINGTQIEIPFISNRLVRKNNITSR